MHVAMLVGKNQQSTDILIGPVLQSHSLNPGTLNPLFSSRIPWFNLSLSIVKHLNALRTLVLLWHRHNLGSTQYNNIINYILIAAIIQWFRHSNGDSGGIPIVVHNSYINIMTVSLRTDGVFSRGRAPLVRTRSRAIVWKLMGGHYRSVNDRENNSWFSRELDYITYAQ